MKSLSCIPVYSVSLFDMIRVNSLVEDTSHHLKQEVWWLQIRRYLSVLTWTTWLNDDKWSRNQTWNRKKCCPETVNVTCKWHAICMKKALSMKCVCEDTHASGNDRIRDRKEDMESKCNFVATLEMKCSLQWSLFVVWRHAKFHSRNMSLKTACRWACNWTSEYETVKGLSRSSHDLAVNTRQPKEPGLLFTHD